MLHGIALLFTVLVIPQNYKLKRSGYRGDIVEKWSESKDSCKNSRLLQNLFEVLSCLQKPGPSEDVDTMKRTSSVSGSVMLSRKLSRMQSWGQDDGRMNRSYSRKI